MQFLAKIKAYFQKNPLMGFVAVIIFVTIFLGIGAFIGTRPKDTAKDESISPTPTEEATDSTSSGTDSDSGTSDSDTTASEHKAIPTTTETEGNTTATPTKSVTAGPTGTVAPTSQPTYNINFLGNMFADINCNGVQDNFEGGSRIKDAVVNLLKSDGSLVGAVSTDETSHYSYNGTQPKGSDLTLKIQVVAPSGYFILDQYKTVTDTVSESTPSRTHNFPLVPNEDKNQCPQ